MRLFEFQYRFRAKTVAIVTLLSTATLGIINLQLNHEAVISQFGSKTGNMLFLVPGVFIVSAVIQVFYAVIISLALYFSSAAFASSVEIGRCFREAFRILLPLPLLTLSDTIGFMTVGRKLISLGLFGKLSYLPFYALVFLGVLAVLPRFTNLNPSTIRIVACIVIVVVFFVSFPFGQDLV